MLLKRFLDWKITLILHWGRVLLKQLNSQDLTFKKHWPKKRRAMKISCLGTVIKVDDSTSRLSIKILWSKLITYLAKENESLIS